MKINKLTLVIPWLLFAAAVTAGIVYYRGHRGQGAAQQQETYYCPMHPTYTSHRKEDSCPICGMNLVKSEEAGPAAQTAQGKIKFYRNPMNPGITSKTPMKDEMGMDYVPVYESEGEAKEVGGRAPIKMDNAKRQLIGVKTARAAYRTPVRAKWPMIPASTSPFRNIRKPSPSEKRSRTAPGRKCMKERRP